MRPDPERVAAVIEEIAAHEIMPHFGKLEKGAVRRKTSATDLVTRVDEAAEAAFRNALGALAPGAGFVGEEAAAADPALTVRDGKNVVEFSVRDATKGDGLRALAERFSPDAVLFAGDDVTDEDALAVLGPDDVGIKVGWAPTIAPFRVADPAAVTAVLEHLLRSRDRLSGGTR